MLVILSHTDYPFLAAILAEETTLLSYSVHQVRVVESLRVMKPNNCVHMYILSDSDSQKLVQQVLRKIFIHYKCCFNGSENGCSEPISDDRCSRRWMRSRRRDRTRETVHIEDRVYFGLNILGTSVLLRTDLNHLTA